jgi:thiamine-phosphate pyrophosphorylase
MMIILISPPTLIPQETQIVEQLFEKGLDTFHLRKPEWTQQALEDYLDKICPTYHSRIVLHQHHSLIEKYVLKGIHFKEADRKAAKNTPSSEPYKSLSKKLTFSTSIHQEEDLYTLEDIFDYVFISPLFESISKEGYTPRRVWDMNLIKPYLQHNAKLIGLGGIDASNLAQVRDWGFDGIALLGAIWQEPDKAVEKWKMCSTALACE